MCEHGGYVTVVMTFVHCGMISCIMACLVDVSSCRRHPCQNGGTCQSVPNDYVCVCADEFTGKLCEEGMIVLQCWILCHLTCHVVVSPMGRKNGSLDSLDGGATL